MCSGFHLLNWREVLKGPFTPKTPLAECLRHFCSFSLVSDYVKEALSYLTSQNSCGYLESYFYGDKKSILIFYVPLACISNKIADCNKPVRHLWRQGGHPPCSSWVILSVGWHWLGREKCFASKWITFDREIMMRKKMEFHLWWFLWNWILKKCFAVRVTRATLGPGIHTCFRTKAIIYGWCYKSDYVWDCSRPSLSQWFIQMYSQNCRNMFTDIGVYFFK